MSRDLRIDPLSPGNGLTAFIQIKNSFLTGLEGSLTAAEENKLDSGELTEAEKETLLEERSRNKGTFKTFKLGTILDIQSQTDRDTNPSYIAGVRNPIEFNTGKRLNTGKVVFETFDEDTIVVIKKHLKTKKDEEPIEIKAPNSFGIDGNTIQETTSESKNTPTGLEEIKYMDQLPPVNIVLIARGQQLAKDNDNNKYNPKKLYKKKYNDVVFLSDSFGVDAVSQSDNSIMDIIIAGKIVPWKGV